MVNYEQILSARVKEVQPSGIRRFFELAAKMPHAISLGVGEPDFETPWQIRRAGIQSLEKGQTFYTSNWGLAELRNQIAALVRRKYRLCYDADKEILVTVGGSEAIDNTIRAIVNVGDEVLIPEPSFVCYKPLTQMAGGVPVPLPTRAEDQFKLTADSLRAAITPRTKLLILPYPNNPTGAIMTRDELQAIATVIKDTNIVVLSDEIYNSLTYGPDRHVCFAELDGMKERTIVVDGFSKSYAMTGWRLGWAMGPKELMRHICKIHQFGIMSAPTTAQFAGIEAIRTGEEDIERMRDQYDIRRLARRLLLERDLARMCLVLRLLYVQVVRGSQLRQTARHQEVAAVALADLDEVALLALALYVCCQNYFHDVYLLLGYELTNLIYGCSFCFSARWSSR